MFTRQVKVQIGKINLQKLLQSQNADSGGKYTNFLSISLLRGRAFSIFRQKMDGRNL